jgi:3-hydroxyacyl-[acyl-carrier-protein] dehydratase
LAAERRSDFGQWPGCDRTNGAGEVEQRPSSAPAEVVALKGGVLEAGAMEEAPVRFALVDINEILKTLPHRYPMLLIDRVINIRTDYSGIGIKNVTFNEPAFAGHFPERPVYPGVMMIEAMAQTAGVIGIKSIEGTEKPSAVYFLTIEKCKFRKPVLPGDTVEYHMRRLNRRKAMWWFHGDAKVNGVTVAEAEVGAMLAD